MYLNTKLCVVHKKPSLNRRLKFKVKGWIRNTMLAVIKRRLAILISGKADLRNEASRLKKNNT